MARQQRYRVLVTRPARRDISAVVSWSLQEFGDAASIRYEALVLQALRDIEADPHRLGVRSRTEFDDQICTYHLHNSRNRVTGSGVVHQPRHFLIYRIKGEVIEVLRLIHDAQDLERHLPIE